MIAVAIVSHNTRELLLECVASAIDSTQGADTEIVIVDNASTDGSAETIAVTWPQVRVIRNNANLGYGPACNQAIRATSAPFVLLLNSDTRVNAEAIREMRRCMQLNPRCAAAGCALVNGEGSSVVNTRNFLTSFNQAVEMLGMSLAAGLPSLRRTYTPRKNASGYDCGVDWIEGACLMLRRAALDEVGPFDERFFMYSEDEDLCFRLKNAGWTICYCGEASIVHHGAASSARYKAEMLCEFYLSQMRFLAKHRGKRTARRYTAAMKLALMAKLFTGRSRTDTGQRIAAIKEACRRLEPGGGA